MITRQATESDTPQIVTLLKESLGESFLPKSEKYWRWKHIDNPFGKSPVLVAEENQMIVGVRAFMRWKWFNKTEVVEAVRAVDTATHPSYQGKGIFSKLTLALLKECEASRLNIVFNTPNGKSMPGYLKMGWEKAGNLPLTVQLVRPFSMAMNILSTRKPEYSYEDDNSVSFFLSHPGIYELVQSEQGQKTNDIFGTQYSVAYMKWRYLDIPVAKYLAAGLEEKSKLNALFIYRIKVTRWGLEFRITDLFYNKPSDLPKINELIDQKVKQHGAHFITFSGNREGKVLSGILTFKSSALGPVVTVRDIIPNQINKFKDFKKWSPTLGDMELF